MFQVGKLFQRVPYQVRDKECSFTPIAEVEEVMDEFLSNYMLSIDNLESVSSNNRDNISNFHIIVNGNMPKDSIYVDYNHSNFEITFEEYKDTKTKTKNINSLMFIEEFRQTNELELAEAFEYMIGCDGEQLFVAIPKEKFNIYKPNSSAYIHRVTLITKKEILKKLANSLDIKIDFLYTQLNPNIIKQVSKDLAITYKKLSSEIGYKPDTINKSASTGKISEQLNKAIEMYIENLKLKDELKDFDIMKKTLSKILS